MSKRVYIYGLYDPETRELRYIGKANNLAKRLWCHIRDAKGGQRTHKAAWIRKLLRNDLKPIISEIWQTTEEGWQEDERACIAQAIEEGTRLTNLTKGGDGILGYSHSEETRRKISEYNKGIGRIPPNWKGRKQSPEHITKRVEARKANDNYGHSQETKDLISRKNTGKNLGNTHTLGMKHTDEWKEEMSRRNSGEDNPFHGRQHSEESKRKISESKKGVKTSDEVRAKLSAAQQARAKRNQAAHLAKIAIPHSELVTMSDDPQINEIYRLYVGGMTKREIAEHLGYKGTGGRFYSKLSKAIKAIPVIEVECLCSAISIDLECHDDWCPMAKSRGAK
jgi:hypothetical protein